jgi:hypothetical protein
MAKQRLADEQEYKRRKLAQEDRKLDIDQHKLLLEEFNLGLLTRDEYRERVNKLEQKD